MRGKFRGLLLGVFLVGNVLTAGAIDRPRVTLGGYLGERFETCLRGNVLKLDLEKDFFPPFVRREGKSGFVGMPGMVDAVRSSTSRGMRRGSLNPQGV